MVTVYPFATGKNVSEEVVLELAFCLTKIKLVVKVTTAKPKTSRKSFLLSCKFIIL
ncbi:hypothetical protein [Ligilactobacillus agilis]|uniref:hypothetical protein n=1 Tax=Ligilactobacillus agilis TaxID=1601 RepID=UPI0015598C73|nr:hypothetical protein [Ligilactobacillus agilis]